MQFFLADLMTYFFLKNNQFSAQPDISFKLLLSEYCMLCYYSSYEKERRKRPTGWMFLEAYSYAAASASASAQCYCRTADRQHARHNPREDLHVKWHHSLVSVMLQNCCSPPVCQSAVVAPGAARCWLTVTCNYRQTSNWAFVALRSGGLQDHWLPLTPLYIYIYIVFPQSYFF